MQKRDVLFHAAAVAAARRDLRRLMAGSAGLRVGEIGAALGITRAYCVPLLEHLDGTQFTVRKNDLRVLRDRAGGD